MNLVELEEKYKNIIYKIIVRRYEYQDEESKNDVYMYIVNDILKKYDDDSEENERFIYNPEKEKEITWVCRTAKSALGTYTERLNKDGEIYDDFQSLDKNFDVEKYYDEREFFNEIFDALSIKDADFDERLKRLAALYMGRGNFMIYGNNREIYKSIIDEHFIGRG